MHCNIIIRSFINFIEGIIMPVDGIGYGSYTPLAPKQQDPAQPGQKELAPKADQNATENAAISNAGTNVDITV